MAEKGTVPRRSPLAGFLCLFCSFPRGALLFPSTCRSVRERKVGSASRYCHTTYETQGFQSRFLPAALIGALHALGTSSCPGAVAGRKACGSARRCPCARGERSRAQPAAGAGTELFAVRLCPQGHGVASPAPACVTPRSCAMRKEPAGSGFPRPGSGCQTRWRIAKLVVLFDGGCFSSFFFFFFPLPLIWRGRCQQRLQVFFQMLFYFICWLQLHSGRADRGQRSDRAGGHRAVLRGESLPQALPDPPPAARGF